MSNADRCARAPHAEAPRAPTRRDLAWRHATESDLGRLNHTTDVGRWRELPPEVSSRAARVLRWFAALHRLGRTGYVGTRASYAAIGASVKHVTREPCSRSTAIRAIGELVGLGYLERSRGFGDRVRQIAPGEYVREPIAVLTLTDKARAIWTEAPPLSHISPHGSKCNGYNSPSQVPRSPKSGEPRPEPAIEIASPSGTAAPHASNAESRSDGVDPAPASAGAAAEPRQSARPVAPLAVLAELERAEGGARQATCQRLRFTSGTRPTTRAAAVGALLATLGRVTRRTPSGPAWCARAAAEIAGSWRGSPCGVEWDYWIARWPELARGERERFARTELVPLLRPPARGAPPLDVPPASPPASPPTSAREKLPPRQAPPPASVPPRAPREIAAPPPPPELPEGENPYAAALARQLSRLAALEPPGGGAA